MQFLLEASVVGAPLIKFLVERVGAGQQQLAHYTKQIVSQIDSPIVSMLDYSDDRPFLEPSLFEFLSLKHHSLSLEQILIHYVLDRTSLESLTVCAARDATVYLPRIGFLEIGDSDSIVQIGLSKLNDVAEHARFVGSTQIEFCPFGQPLSYMLFTHDFDGIPSKEQSIVDWTVPNDAATSINLALEALSHVAPELRMCLDLVTKRFVVFRSSENESFATVQSHGTAFLNVPDDDHLNEVFFLEDITHQCGHILLTASTLDKSQFVRVAPEKPLAEVTESADEHRDVYTAFHGVFTEALMCSVLYACLEERLFADRLRHELLGRLSFAMKRFHLDLICLKHEYLFTDLGWQIIQDCGTVFDEVFRKTEDRITGFDLTNQPYSFDYLRFAERNSITC